MIDPDDIDKQLSKLPENIGRFGRRFFGFNDKLQIQYTTRNVEVNIYSPAQGNDVLFVEAGEDLEKLIEQTLVTIETYNTLEEKRREFDPGVYIDPNFIEQGVTNAAEQQKNQRNGWLANFLDLRGFEPLTSTVRL